MAKKLRFVSITMVLGVLLSGVSFAASVSEPLWDWKYAALERLSSASGAGSANISNLKPFDRAEMARQTMRIKSAFDNGGAGSWHNALLLARLEKDLAAEIKTLKEGADGQGKISPLNWMRIFAERGDLPLRLENEYGFLADRVATRVEISTSGEWEHFAYEIRPRIDSTTGQAFAPSVGEGYLLFKFGNFEAEAGKDAMWWGPGKNGAAIMSSNPPAFNMLKFSTNAPVDLPWLGPTKFVLFFGQTGNQDVQMCLDSACTTKLIEGRSPFLTGYRLDFKPAEFLEIGGSYKIMMAPRTGENSSLGNWFQTAFFPNWTQNETSAYTGLLTNFEGGADFTFDFSRDYSVVRLLGMQSLKFYVEYVGETLTRDVGTLGPSIQFPSTKVGFYMDAGISDVSVEHTTNSNQTEWYRHYQFFEGMTNNGFIIGDPTAGYLLDDYFVRVGVPLDEKRKLNLFLESETHSSNSYNAVLAKTSAGADLECRLTDSDLLKFTYNYRWYNFSTFGSAATHLFLVDFQRRF
jgi:hypothetical protein